MAHEYAIELKGITKTFGSVVANNNVELQVRPGEILALLGENGSGKTTLMNMLSGIYKPDRGQIFVDGKEVAINSPEDSKRLGIGMVHQHFKLVDVFSAADNIWMGREKPGFLLKKDRYSQIEAIAKKFGFDIDPEKKVHNMSVSEKQTLEIIKVLYYGAKIIILDEPTAVLTTQETSELFKELINLKNQGYTIIFISHKLNEIMQITDRMTILRGGKSMGVHNTSDVDPETISRLMVGRDVVLKVEKEPAKPTDVVLRVRDLEYTNEWGKKMLDNFSMDLRKGEILGIAGVEGNGQKELVDMLFNFNVPDYGTITVNGENILGVPQRQIREKGVSLVPEDRMIHGIAGTASIEENLISDRAGAKELNNGPLFNMKAIHNLSEELIRDYKVLCKSGAQQVKMLSGGNIQKVVVAREFSNNPKLIIADQPTRGIDVGATEFIRKKLVELSRSGIAVLLVSADLNEVMELSDSLIVMYGGKIAAYFEDTKDLNDEIMGEYMLGLKQQTAEEIGRVCHE